MWAKGFALLGVGVLGLLCLSGCGSKVTGNLSEGNNNGGGSSGGNNGGGSSGGGTSGPKITGQIVWVPQCGSSPSLPAFTVTINTTPQQQVQTDSNGNFSFAGVANGSYDITPSYSGPSGSSSVFLPNKLNVTMNNADVSSENFQVALGYTVSGSVTYSGSHTGRIYVDLASANCGGSDGSGGYGASISAAGSYTIHGVQPGSYTLRAWMDPLDLGLGQAMLNAYDPTASSPVTVNTSNVSSANVKLVDNNGGSAPASAPQLNGITPMHDGVVVEYNAVRNSDGLETATSYDVAWSSSSALDAGSLASVSGTANYKALGTGNLLFFLNNSIHGVSGSPFGDGNVYYFQVRADNPAGPGPWAVYGGAKPTAVTVGPASPNGGISVSTTIDIPSGVTIASGAPLYIGYLSPSGFYGAEVSGPQMGDNIAAIKVPRGSWLLLGMLDQNNDGEIDVGDITNSRQDGPPGVTVASGSGSLSETLPAGNMVPVVRTDYYQDTYNGGSSSGYLLPIGAGEGAKLPVAVTLTAASDPDVLLPMDFSNYCLDCRNAEFQNDLSLGSFAPKVGDTYTMTVTYADGSQGTVTATISGWNGGSSVVGASDLPTNLSPTGTSSTSTTPTFTWTNPGGVSSGDYYSFYICCDKNQVIWQIPDGNVQLNGISPSIDSIQWGADPTGSTGNTPNPSSLTAGTAYNWSLQLIDTQGNMAQAQTWYQP